MHSHANVTMDSAKVCTCEWAVVSGAPCISQTRAAVPAPACMPHACGLQSPNVMVWRACGCCRFCSL